MKKVIVITGANSGLGFAIADSLRDQELILLSNSGPELVKQAKKLACEYYLCDVTDYAEVENVINLIIKKHSKIDVLINNAGVWLAGDINTDNSYEQIANCMDVNARGPIFMTKAVLPTMYSRKSGLIINIGSSASFDTDDYSCVYNASKWAVRGFTLSLQKSAAKNNVKITGFYPGFMMTDFFKKAGNDYNMSTALEVEKVAKAICFIVNCEDDVLIPELSIKDIENF